MIKKFDENKKESYQKYSWARDGFVEKIIKLIFKLIRQVSSEFFVALN